MTDDAERASAPTEYQINAVLLQLQLKKGSLTSKPKQADYCIYRVPISLRNVRPEAYTPQLISIGPLHHGDEKLEAMEKQKEIYIRKFTERFQDGLEIIKDLVSIILKKEQKIRDCYSGNLNEIESRTFIQMILMDAVFIIEFMDELKKYKGPENFEPWMIFDIREDLMLLENQLPFLIIQEIYDKVNSARQDAAAIPFSELATFYFGKYTIAQEPTNQSVKDSKHFTDLLRNFMLKGSTKRSSSSNHIKMTYSAVMLRNAGVKFEVTHDKCLVNIKFEKGVLKIPHLEVDHCFERLVRNIMALEQCLYQREAKICSYIKFMDHLINSAEDVGLLVEKGIILHWLGDDAAVSTMINKLCENIGDIYGCYDDTCQNMNDHCKNPFNRMMATLELGYFSDVWRGTATVAAAILLILTLIQTITSVKSVF